MVRNMRAYTCSHPQTSSEVEGDCRPTLTMTSPTHSYGVGINEEDTLGTMRSQNSLNARANNI